MRVDLTVRDAAGRTTDVAVISRAPATLGALATASPELVVPPCWVGAEAVGPDVLVGAGPLRHGIVLNPRPAPATAPTGAVVRVTSGRDGGVWRPLGGTAITVGRDPGCDVVLTDPDVSRRHLVVTPGEPLPTVTDLGSTNGTLLDGDPVGADPLAVPAGGRIQLGDTCLAVEHLPEPAATPRAAPDGTVRINRAAWVPPAASPDDEIALPEPDTRGSAARIQWLAALVPAALGIGLAVVLHSPQYLLFALMSPVLMLATGFGDHWHGRRVRRRTAAIHRVEQTEVDATIASRLAAERATATLAWPDPVAVARIAAVPTVRLWERSTRDGLRLRLGLGPAPSALRVRDATGARPAAELDRQPAVVDLAAGALGLVAPSGHERRAARWLVAQLAACYSPAEVEISVLADEATAAAWEWVRWLPHARGRNGVGTAAAVRLLDEVTAQRPRRGSPVAADRPPWLLLIVDPGAAAGELGGLAALLRDGAERRVAAVCVAASTAELPDGCVQVASVTGETGGRAGVRSAGGAVRAVVLDEVDTEWAEAVARSLAPYVDAEASGSGACPDSCRLPELHDHPVGESLVRQLWARGDPGARAVVGLGPDGPVEIDLVRDGPHALVAGTTGAGKSELLQTWVAGLALSHPPSDLAFVLIDYKGGAAFGSCSRLPHVTAMVTDLDADLTRRALRSLHAELRRRERLLADAEAADLTGYRRGGPAEPLPRLVIVVDEFAALADELPTFVAGLVGIAQRGRSLGVHLVLATQRPGGAVSPEIRANCALRIALRVLEPAESADVIGVDIAAGIDPARPGRAYLARGRAPELVQFARATAPGSRAAVRVVPLDRWRQLRAAAEPPDAATDLDDVIAAVTGVAAASGLAPPSRPWLAALPAALPVDELSADDGIPLGLLDLPDEQRQAVETVELTAGGGLLFVGSARSGRTTALLTIAVGAARVRTPSELHVHVLDFGGGALGWLRPLPHVGTVVSDDPAAAAALLTALEEQLADRLARRFATTAEDRPGEPPAVLVLLDGWEAFVRASEDHDHGASVERLAALLRAGGRAGLTVAVAGDRTACAPRLAALMRERYVLRFSDPADYATAGLTAAQVSAARPVGRAIRAGDGADLLIAHAGREPTPTATRAAIDEIARHSAPHTDRGEPRVVIRPLPDQVPLAGLPARPGTVVLGCGGNDARPLDLDPLAGAGRLLIAGPPRSGRSTVLRLLIAQREQLSVPIVLAAASASPARPAAADAGLVVIDPADPADEVADRLRRPALLLVDDTELFLDTAAGEALQAAARAQPALGVIAGGRSDELLVTFRGIVAEVRRHRCALLLQPSAGDLELIGERPARLPALTRPGRGLIRADPAAQPLFARGPVPIQIALP